MIIIEIVICYFQGSPEAPLIFSLVLKVFGGQPVAELQKAALQKGVSGEDFQVLIMMEKKIFNCILMIVSILGSFGVHCWSSDSFGKL